MTDSHEGDLSIKDELSISIKSENDDVILPTPLNTDSSTNKARKLPKLEPRHPVKKVKPSPPVHEMVGGSSVRQYLNRTLTQHLLEGLREVSKNKPEDPLRELGQFLITRSEELKKNENLAK